jgi:hypothetical protein
MNFRRNQRLTTGFNTDQRCSRTFSASMKKPDAGTGVGLMAPV